MNTNLVWERIVEHSGDTFYQIRGKAFTYDASGRTIRLHTTNWSIPRSAIDEALTMVPLLNTTVVQHLMGPSYIYAILSDPRVRGSDW